MDDKDHATLLLFSDKPALVRQAGAGDFSICARLITYRRYTSKCWLSGDRVGEPAECIRARVQTARNIQLQRFSKNGSSDIICNADMRVGEIRQFCRLPEDGQSLMQAAMNQLNLSPRAYYRILKLARTIADLAGCEEIQSVHLAEALQYRRKLMLS